MKNRKKPWDNWKVIDCTKDYKDKEICCHQVMKELGYPVDLSFPSSTSNDPLILKFNMKVILLKLIKNDIKHFSDIKKISDSPEGVQPIIDKLEAKSKEVVNQIYEITGKLGWTVKNESS